MINFLRKTRQQLLAQNRVSKYLLYAIGEIVLVVIGILIALQINNWNEFKKDRSTTITRPDSLRFDPKYPKILEKQPTRRGNWWIFDRETVMDIF